MLVHLGAAVSAGFQPEATDVGVRSLEWQAGLTFSYVTVTGKKKGKKKKKMDRRKPFKSHTKMSHLGLMLPLKQE